MPPFGRGSVSHWSVDFVEHLRTVHFGLVTVSVALIVLISGSRSARDSRALTQAQQIVDLPDRWSDVQSALYFSGIHSLHLPEQHRYLITIIDDQASNKSASVVLDADLNKLTQFEPWKFLPTGIEMQSGPKNLSDFILWWNALAQASVYVPDFKQDEPKQCKAQTAPGGESRKETKWAFHQGTEINTTFLKCDVTHTLSPTAISASAVSLGTPFGDNRPYLVAKAFDAFNGVTSGMPWGSDVNLAVGPHFSVAKVDESALRSIFPDWRVGAPYDVAFNELAEVSKDLLAIKLKDVPVRLQDMLPKGEQDLEAFGLKIPGSDIARWGIVLILAAQFYFWLHLHELKTRIAASSPGWDVAWIGVYRSMSARISMIVSACALPIFALETLATRIRQTLDHLATTGYPRFWQMRHSPLVFCWAWRLLSACIAFGPILGVGEIRGGACVLNML